MITDKSRRAHAGSIHELVEDWIAHECFWISFIYTKIIQKFHFCLTLKQLQSS